ncbi:MAG TPA: DUF3465 domain-containing protein [Candidatus Peregrinibacteria bacterium]|nr:DUF3465 domain-containing protein [Candidatus Peregrinibacteria bacterium]
MPEEKLVTLKEAFEKKLDQVYTKVTGNVMRLLKDDTEGHCHQRFILQDDEGSQVIIVHNVDIFERIPLVTGERMEIYGKYIWTEIGGLIHWTHHPVHGECEGGYIKLLDTGYTYK